MAQYVRWVEDTSALPHVEELDCTIEVVEGLSLSEIDIESSRRNNARLDDPFIQAMADSYELAMIHNHPFPMVFLRPMKKGRFSYFILSGNHRIGAIWQSKELAKVCNAYIVYSDSELVYETIIRYANRWCGERQDDNEAVIHARRLIKKYGISVEKAAESACVKPDWLRRELRHEEQRDLLRALSIAAVNEISGSHLNALCRLGNDNLLKRTAVVMRKYDMTSRKLGKLVSDLNKRGRTEATGGAVLDHWEKEMEKESARTRGLRKYSPASLFATHMNTLANFINTGNSGQPYETFGQMKLPDREKQLQLYVSWKDLKRSIDGIFLDARRQYGHLGKTTAISKKKRR